MKTRRRFLIDLLCLGGVLGGASQLQPFFGHFLEGQDKPAPTAPPASPIATRPTPKEADITEAYPSDSDMHAVTQAYPSDSDMQAVTKAYPSDSDMHEPKPDLTRAYPSDNDAQNPRPHVTPKKAGPTSVRPFWEHFS